MPTVCIKPIRENATRRNRVPRDAFRSTVRSKTAREALDGGFRACIQGMVLYAGRAGCNRGCKDDAVPVSAVLKTVLGHVELAAGIEVEDFVIILLRHLSRLSERLDAGVRYGLDTAEVRKGLLEERVVGDVSWSDFEQTMSSRAETR